MRYFDPLRPQSDGMGLYAPSGHALSLTAGLPHLTLLPLAPSASEADVDAEWEASILMPTSSNAYSYFTARFATTSALQAFLVRWLADPETEIATTFAYTFDAKLAKQRTRSRATERSIASALSELGLDDL